MASKRKASHMYVAAVTGEFDHVANEDTLEAGTVERRRDAEAIESGTGGDPDCEAEMANAVELGMRCDMLPDEAATERSWKCRRCRGLAPPAEFGMFILPCRCDWGERDRLLRRAGLQPSERSARQG